MHSRSFRVSFLLMLGIILVSVSVLGLDWFNGTFNLSAYKMNISGEGAVCARFDSDVDWGEDGTVVFYEVEGESMAFWYEADYAYRYPDEIRLADTWQFTGVSVRVTTSDIGLEPSGSTVTWDGEDTSGTRTSLTHDYNGIRATSRILLWSMRQTTAAEVKFGGNFITTSATKYRCHLVKVF